MTLATTDRYADIPGPAPQRLDDVPGWLTTTDNFLFRWFLERQNRLEHPGDLLELGVFQGRSAIHIGSYRKPDERFTVCDLFDHARDEESIRPGARKAYANLTQAIFERNYLAFHDELPAIVRGLTETIVDHVAPGTCRFAHIDASHMYEHVRGDLIAVRSLLRTDGIVVFDDYRTEHCPGTAAAVWEAMATEGLRVVCVSANKFYGTWGNATPMQDDLIEHVASRSDHRCDLQRVMGQRLVRLAKIAAPKPAKSLVPVQVADGAAGALLAQSREVLDAAARVLNDMSRPTPRQAWKRIAVAVLPPVVTDAVRHRSGR
jgi:Methyltransferase domain